MELITIDLPLPDIIGDVYQKSLVLNERLSSFSNETVRSSIAGGCLSNTYMGRSFKDIDLFIEYPSYLDYPPKSLFKQVFGSDIDVLDYEIDNSYVHFKHPMLYSFSYNGYQIDLIFCEKLERIYDFDLRFRQFYLLDGEVQTTKEAMQDIKEKKLVLSSPCSPLATYIRCMHFKEELGFSIDSFSEQCLFHFINVKSYGANEVLAIIDHKKGLHPNSKQQLIDWVHEYSEPFDYNENELCLKIPNTSFPFHKDLQSFLDKVSHSYTNIERNKLATSFGVWGDHFHRLVDYKPTTFSYDRSFSLSLDDIRDGFSAFLKTFAHYLKINRVKVLSEGRTLRHFAFFNEEEDFFIDSQEYFSFYKQLYHELMHSSLEKNYELFHSQENDNTLKTTSKWKHFVQDVLNEFLNKKNMMIRHNLFTHLLSEFKIVSYDHLSTKHIGAFLDGHIHYISLEKEVESGTFKLGEFSILFQNGQIEVDVIWKEQGNEFVLQLIKEKLTKHMEKIFIKTS